MDWDIGPDGEVVLFPLTGFAIEASVKMAVLMRVEFLWQTPDGELDKGAVQLSLTPNQARQLAGEILRAADEARPGGQSSV